MLHTHTCVHTQTTYEQLSQAIAALELGTHYSRACCQIIAAEGGVSGLLRLIRVLNRSK